MYSQTFKITHPSYAKSNIWHHEMKQNIFWHAELKNTKKYLSSNVILYLIFAHIKSLFAPDLVIIWVIVENIWCWKFSTTTLFEVIKLTYNVLYRWLIICVALICLSCIFIELISLNLIIFRHFLGPFLRDILSGVIAFCRGTGFSKNLRLL